MPDGIAARLRAWLDARPDAPGSALLGALEPWAREHGGSPDALVYELVDGVLGAHYAVPPAMLEHCGRIAAHYLRTIMGEGFPGPDEMDVFATEGGTAAMRYIFDTLFTNGLLERGDKVAVTTPVFAPYLDIAALPEYALDRVPIEADGTFADGHHSWQFPPEQIDKLRDPAVKLLVCINPTNPTSVRIADETIARIAEIVRTDNPGLIIVSDDVYASFADDFRSLSAVVPDNTILVYSLSKYFGATGWRLGLIATSRTTVLNAALAAVPADVRARLARRYSSITDDIGTLTFFERLVADSRDVALNHTAGLSQPQQVQLALFALFDMLDTGDVYRGAARTLIADRLAALVSGLGIELSPDPRRTGYYLVLDFLAYARHHFPAGFAAYLEQNYEPADILFRLAVRTEVVALNGPGFDGPPWSIRLSLANLDAGDYLAIGTGIRRVAEEYVAEWRGAAPGDDRG